MSDRYDPNIDLDILATCTTSDCDDPCPRYEECRSNICRVLRRLRTFLEGWASHE